MRVLVVEDDPQIQRSLLENLTSAGYQAQAVGDGLSALQVAQQEPWDLLILDGHLPVMDGAEVLTRLRARGETVPVLMLTARGAELERIKCFEAGADDYLVKPYSTMELLVRIKAILRRAKGFTRRLGVLRSGSFRLDSVRLEATRDGQPLQLLAKEAQLLEAFLRHPQRTLSREELLTQIWQADGRPTPRTVDAHVARLRKKLGEDVLLTLAGEGYRWTLPVQEEGP